MTDNFGPKKISNKTTLALWVVPLVLVVLGFAAGILLTLEDLSLHEDLVAELRRSDVEYAQSETISTKTTYDLEVVKFPEVLGAGACPYIVGSTIDLMESGTNAGVSWNTAPVYTPDRDFFTGIYYYSLGGGTSSIAIGGGDDAICPSCKARVRVTGPLGYDETRTLEGNYFDIHLSGDPDLAEGVYTITAQVTDAADADFSGGACAVANSFTVDELENCGNGIREGSENCDGADLNSQTCVTQGFDSGSLTCTAGCNFNTSACVGGGGGGAVCGNGVKEVGEACDTSDLGGNTCQSFGFDTGSLACNGSCTGFDISGCSDFVAPPAGTCGNGTKESGEVCDGNDLGGQTCTSIGFSGGGTLACNPDCNTFNLNACITTVTCGNGTVDPGEQCDSLNFNGQSCFSLGFDAGQLSCAGSCVYDTEFCVNYVEVCNDGQDNDLDGHVDCDDLSCSDDPICNQPGAEICNDGVDNDGNGDADCADSACSTHEVCGELEFCNDGIDNDGDTFVDCNDADCSANLNCVGGGVEICNDGIDNDANGNTDCNDAECSPHQFCENAEVCTDGVDNNENGFIDCNDIDCTYHYLCLEAGEICIDNRDNDGDEDIDCNDSDCFDNEACENVEICNDGIDNDGDNFFDCNDLNCNGAESCLAISSEICTDGVDNDSNGAADCADSFCESHQFCVGQEICDDEIDNDSDGYIDCNDLTCISNETCNIAGAENCLDGIDNDQNGATDCDDNKCNSSQACLLNSILPETGAGGVEGFVEGVQGVYQNIGPVGNVITGAVGVVQFGSITPVVGVVAGAVGAIGSSGLAISRLVGLFSSFFERKRRPWGIVFNGEDRNGIAFATIDAVNPQGQFLASAISDLEGRFTLILEPGKYKLVVKHSDFQFVPQVGSGDKQDKYDGEEFEVKEGEPIAFDIMMLPADKTTTKKLWFTITNNLRKFFNEYKWFVSSAGLLFSIIAIIVDPGWLTWGVLIVYLISVIWNFFVKNDPKDWGEVFDSISGVGVPHAKVEVFDDKGEILDSQLTDERGRYGFYNDYVGERLFVSALGYKFPAEQVSGNKEYEGPMLRIRKKLKGGIPLDPIVNSISSKEASAPQETPSATPFG